MSDSVNRQSIFPVIRYRDPDEAISWLRRAFGLTERVVYRDEESGIVHHAEMNLEGNLIMVGHASPAGWFGGKAPDPLASTGSLYAVVADPDAHYDRAAAAGANIVRELADQSYGSREYSARDLEGNFWSFGTYCPD